MPIEYVQAYHKALIEFHERRLVELEIQLKRCRTNRRKRMLEHKIRYHSTELEELREKLMERKERRKVTYRRRGGVLTRRSRRDEE